MKKLHTKKILFTLIIALIFTGCSEDSITPTPPPIPPIEKPEIQSIWTYNSLQKMGIKGNVKTIHETTIGEENSKDFFSFNEKGYIENIEREYVTTSILKFEYDNIDRLKSITTISPTTSLKESQLVYTYGDHDKYIPITWHQGVFKNYNNAQYYEMCFPIFMKGLISVESFIKQTNNLSYINYSVTPNTIYAKLKGIDSNSFTTEYKNDSLPIITLGDVTFEYYPTKRIKSIKYFSYGEPKSKLYNDDISNTIAVDHNDDIYTYNENLDIIEQRSNNYNISIKYKYDNHNNWIEKESIIKATINNNTTTRTETTRRVITYF